MIIYYGIIQLELLELLPNDLIEISLKYVKRLVLKENFNKILNKKKSIL